jgi:hypothetical protein
VKDLFGISSELRTNMTTHYTFRDQIGDFPCIIFELMKITYAKNKFLDVFD